MLFINILDSLTAPCLVYNIHVYSIGTVLPVWAMQWVHAHTMAGVWFTRTLSQRLLSSCTFFTNANVSASAFYPSHPQRSRKNVCILHFKICRSAFYRWPFINLFGQFDGPCFKLHTAMYTVFPALTSASLYFRQCKCLSLPTTCRI